MGWLVDLLTLPALGGPRLVRWLATTIAQEAQQESLDEGSVRGELVELQQRYDSGELGEEEYDRQEGALVARLSSIRELKARNGW